MPDPLDNGIILQPKTLIIWGEQDGALEVEGAELSVRLCRDGHLERIADASHWVSNGIELSTAGKSTGQHLYQLSYTDILYISLVLLYVQVQQDVPERVNAIMEGWLTE